MRSRAAVSPDRIQLGVVQLQPGAVGLLGDQAKVLVQLADARRRRPSRRLRAVWPPSGRSPGPTGPRKSMVVNCTIRSRFRLALMAAIDSARRSPDTPEEFTRILRLSGSIDSTSASNCSCRDRRGLMAVDVDDGIPRPRHRMLRHDQRGVRLVFADVRQGKLRLAVGAGPADERAPFLARQGLCTVGASPASPACSALSPLAGRRLLGVHGHRQIGCRARHAACQEGEEQGLKSHGPDYMCPNSNWAATRPRARHLGSL